ncbi:unnamed protein product [Onchocerca flexuosa]|uniref:Hypoxia up-regulated protein 1 n=1 Tax=Onchocerca flexuosa TaxID=387005 RepID=A0A183HZJ7_9BILA|nr:unnamed protein product [Onchocerca flexuosa]
MSIDFGSQWIKMALVKPGVPMEIVLNEEARRKTPNLIIIKDDERLFGDAALTYSVKHSNNSFTHLVDLLGKKIDNPIVSLYKQRFPHLKFILDDTRGVMQFDVNGEIYSVESIVAMILRRCREVVEKFAKQPVRDVVITVPAFFNQAERRALVAAAEIAELNLLQVRLLLNDHIAAGLNYGAFRRKEITESAQTLLIYDVGATKVTASVLEYVLIEEKKRGEKNPVMTTLGIGYNRMVGGFEITQRLRDIFVNNFRKTKKTKTDITENSLSMAKMLKEAEHVKIVLSANVDFIAQIENVHEKQDFTMLVTRTMLEDAMRDLEVKLVQPIVDALKMADLLPEKINQVVLMGGGSRVPLIQEFVQKFFKKKELGKFLNTDEAIAMGAVYQAAHLSKGFKVKKFDVRDLQIFPVQVDFISAHSKDETGAGRIIHRPIYPIKSFIPASKKVLSFTSFTEDFSMNVNYGEMNQLNADQLIEFGSLNISEIKIGGVTDVYVRETAKEGTIFKGIKTHFDLDNSGILHVDGAEILLERPPKAESTLASLAGKITGLFSSDNKIDEISKGKSEGSLKSEEINDKNHSTVDIAENQTKTEKPVGDNVTSTGRSTEANKTVTNAAETKQEEKPQQIKISLKLMESKMDVLPIPDSEIIAAKNRIVEFERKEREKAIREEAHHNLESLAIDLSDKLTQDEFMRFLTTDEHTVLQKEVSQVKAWLEDDVDSNTPTAEFVQNKKTIDELLRPVKVRMREDQERPSVVAELISMFNHTEIFLLLAQNLSETEVFTKVEINTLSKLLDETKDWLAEKMELQNKLKPTDPPAFAVSEGKEKLMSLDREVKYLLNKMKFAKPKVKKGEKTKEAAAENNETLSETVEESKTVLEEKPFETSRGGQPIEDATDVEKNEELKNGEQKNGTIHDASEL